VTNKIHHSDFRDFREYDGSFHYLSIAKIETIANCSTQYIFVCVISMSSLNPPNSSGVVANALVACTNVVAAWQTVGKFLPGDKASQIPKLGMSNRLGLPMDDGLSETNISLLYVRPQSRKDYHVVVNFTI
jgi:hypothetical protein